MKITCRLLRLLEPSNPPVDILRNLMKSHWYSLFQYYLKMLKYSIIRIVRYKVCLGTRKNKFSVYISFWFLIAKRFFKRCIFILYTKKLSVYFFKNGYRYHKRTTILKKRVHVLTVKMIKINFCIQLPVWVVQNCPYSPVSPAPIP